MAPPMSPLGVAFYRHYIKFKHHPHIHRLFTAPAAVKRQPTQRSSWESQNKDLNNLWPDQSFSPRFDSYTYDSLLQSCASFRSISQVHAHMLVSGLGHNPFLEAKLVSMYAMSGSMEHARLVFDKIQKPNAYLWNEIIKGYACNGSSEEALALYYQMQQAGIPPDNFTFPFVLKACAGLSSLSQGKEIHEQINKSPFARYIYVGNALIDMYAKCGRMDLAGQVFDKMPKRDVVSWTAMISGCVQNGCAHEALRLFSQMQLAGVKPNRVTILSVLPACSDLADLQQARDIHDYIIQNGFESDVTVQTALVVMYAKCGNIKVARQLFDKLSERDVVLWSAMIAAYAQSGHANEALRLFDQMQLAGMKPNSHTMVSVLQACSHLGALQQGKWIHGYIDRNGFESNVFVGTALIDMYAKCGNIGMAQQLFDNMSKRNVVSWSAMIAAYGMHGHGKEALAVFSKMKETGMKPNHITFICVLSACSHGGLVDEGWRYFDCMSQDYCIMPRVEHYSCMVDLLGRAGCLDEAHLFIKNMPLEPDAGVWGALLGACRVHCNIELGEHAAEHLFELEPKNAGYYVLLSNIYAAAGRWDDVEKIRTMMKVRGLKKTAGCSLIEVNNRFNAFLVGDKSHPESDKIYAMLETLAGQMKDAGYVPNTNFVLHEIEEEVEELMFCTQSEKLAIAFAITNTCPGTPIDISKNLHTW